MPHQRVSLRRVTIPEILLIWPTVSWLYITASALQLEFRHWCGVTILPPAPRLGPSISLRQASLPDPNRPNGVGENLAGFNPSKGVSASGEGQSLWVDEKKNWHGGVLTPENWSTTGYYTQMVWKDTKQVGCATASGNGHPFSILVCRYSPAGNFMGQAPF